MLQDLCKSFQRGFLRDSVHAKADFLIFLSPKCLLIGHDNENHYRSIQRKLQPKIEFDYTEKQNALDLIRQQKPMMVVVSDIAHYLFMGEPLLEIIEWVHQLQELVLSYNGSVFIRSHLDSDQDVELVQLNQWIGHSSDVLIDCDRLESGYTESVDGMIRIARGPKVDKAVVTNGTLLYRVTETGPLYYSKGGIL